MNVIFTILKKSIVKAFQLKIETFWTTCYNLGWPDSIQTNSALSGHDKHGPLSMTCRLWWKVLCFEYVLGPWPDSYLWMQLEDEGAGCLLQGL